MNELYELIEIDETLSREDKEILWFIMEQIGLGRQVLINYGETPTGELYEDILHLKMDYRLNEAYMNEEGKSVLEIFYRIQVPHGPTFSGRQDVKDINKVYENMKSQIPFYKRLFEMNRSGR